MPRVEVTFKDPPDVVFAYLADPRNRPQWQSSLKSVQMLSDGLPHVGMRWRDVTSVGVKPLMEITRMTPYRVWAETGTWRGVTADLELRFTALSAGTRVSAETSIVAGGLWAGIAGVVRRLAPPVLTRDLQAAADLIHRR